MDHPEILESLQVRILACQQAAHNPVVYQGDPLSEQLYHTDLDASVEYMLETKFHTPEDFPDTIEVGTFTRLVPTSPNFAYPSLFSPLSELLLHLDEEHLGPDEPDTKPTENMQRAERQFIHAALLDYRSYWCEITETATVNVHAWLQAHKRGNPDWTPVPSFQKAVCGHCHNVRGAQEMRTCAACKRKGCSVCWREAKRASAPWPRSAYKTAGCAFRLSEADEQAKANKLYEHESVHKGWGFRFEGPVDAE